jgi:DNA-binding NarL/FixJ family response regulator
MIVRYALPRAEVKRWPGPAHGGRSDWLTCSRSSASLLAKTSADPVGGVEEHLLQRPRQVAQVAKLARDGHSNQEIGAQLFISPRTVEWHLGNVFTKLGITSRKDLR